MLANSTLHMYDYLRYHKHGYFSIFLCIIQYVQINSIDLFFTEMTITFIIMISISFFG